MAASHPPAAAVAGVRLRDWPWPFRSAMTICSDLDETPDRDVYLTIARFMNTTQATPMRPGVGLEIGNTIYFDMPANQFAYRTTDDRGRAMIHALIHSGHIDCLHSYGDFADRRERAERAIEDLTRHDCRLQVWVDHSKSPSNFGPDIMVGSGDVPDTPAYHADLTLGYGIRYVWRGRTTGVIGQNGPAKFCALWPMFHAGHPLRSGRALLKEAVKIHLGRRDHPRWEMYADNEILRPSTLRDGRPIWEFMRFNPYWAGSGQGDTAAGFADVVTDHMLDILEHRQAGGILYTHLGKVRDPARPFNDCTVEAFRRLERRFREGRTFVTTTYRLLRYLTARRTLRCRAEKRGEDWVIRIEGLDDPVTGFRAASREEVMGLTFTLPERAQGRVDVMLSDAPVPVALHHEQGCTHVAVAWEPLKFPDLD